MVVSMVFPVDFQIGHPPGVAGGNIFHQGTIVSMVVMREALCKSFIHCGKPTRTTRKNILGANFRSHPGALQQSERIGKQSDQKEAPAPGT